MEVTKGALNIQEGGNQSDIMVMHSTESTFRVPLIEGLKEKLGDEYSILNEMSGKISSSISIRKQTDLIIVKADQVSVDAQGKLYCNETAILCIVETKDVTKDVLAGLPQFWKYYSKSAHPHCKLFISTNYSNAILVNPREFLKQETLTVGEASLKSVKELGIALGDEFLTVKELKEIESDGIKKIISYNADMISNYVNRIDPVLLNDILDFYIFGFKEEEETSDKFDEASNSEDTSEKEEKKLLLTDDVDKGDFENYKFRVGTYVLISQIMFYSIFEKQDNEKDSPKYVLSPLGNAKSIRDIIDDFQLIAAINYEPIYHLDLLTPLYDTLCDSSSGDAALCEACFDSLMYLGDLLSIVDHSLLIKYDILGKLYHALIPVGLRKTLAAYYTKYPVARFILEMTVRGTQFGPVMDPTCGSGTFLISAYQKIAEMDPTLDHATILANIYGNDITSFAVLLATINLAFQDIEEATNRCFISREDVFDLRNRAYSIDEYLQKKKETETISMAGTEKVTGYAIPKIQYIVGNPPFTRGERLPHKYSNKLRGYFESANKKSFLTKNMPLHGYILLDLDRYLKKNGSIGLVLPYSTLHIDKLAKIRAYMLDNYRVECVITSEVEPFSEDTDLKEIVFVATRSGPKIKEKKAVKKTGNKPTKKSAVKTALPDYDIKFVTLRRELTLSNFKPIARLISDNKENVENEMLRVRHVSKIDLETKHNEDWSLFFQAESKLGLFDLLSSNPNIGEIQSIENASIKAFRGFRQDVAKYWMVPNPEWEISENDETHIEIINVHDKDSKIALGRDFLLQSLTTSKDYDLPIIDQADGFILKNDGGPIIRDSDLKKYVNYVKGKIPSDQFDLFLAQLNKIGKKFQYSGRIAFPHRFDLETGRILCFLAPEPVNLSQSWFTISGLSKEFEDLLVAWFNSSLFFISYLVSRRQQRGPFGQTAIKQFRHYLIPLPDKVALDDQKQVFKLFKKYNKSTLLNLTVEEQFKITKESENERRILDRAFLELIGILPHKEVAQNSWLNELYAAIAKEIEYIKMQRKEKPQKGVTKEKKARRKRSAVEEAETEEDQPEPSVNE